MVAKRKAVTMGEPGGLRSERLRSIQAAFERAGFAVEISPNMNAGLRPDVALVGPFANGFAMACGSGAALARNRMALRMALQAAREVMTALNEGAFTMAEAIGMDTPMMRAVHRYSDPAVPPAAVNRAGWSAPGTAPRPASAYTLRHHGGGDAHAPRRRPHR